MLSIIIPCLNEEEYLPLLLESVKKQKFLDYEIILADAGSKDKTLQIAKKYNCKIVPGGLPSKGRNQGAKKAKGDLLLFLDADVILPDGFFKDADILVCESSFEDGLKEQAHEHLHLTSTQAGEIAKKAKVKKLVLTHLSQRYERNTKFILNEAKKVFKNTLVVKDFDSVSV